jgi:hypothetical protein
MGPDRFRTGRGVGQIGLILAQGDHIGLSREFRGNLAGLSEDEDPHRHPAFPSRSPTPCRA